MLCSSGTAVELIRIGATDRAQFQMSGHIKCITRFNEDKDKNNVKTAKLCRVVAHGEAALKKNMIDCTGARGTV